MELGQRAVSAVLGDRGRRVERVQETTRSPRQWDARAQDAASGETQSATAKGADAAALAVTGRRLDAREQGVAAPLLHYAFGTAAGALYGALVELRPDSIRGGGLVFGMTLWAAADQLGVSLIDLAPDPSERPLVAELYSVVSHVAYGVTTETVRVAVRSQLP
jgi:hypothetical protein